MAKDKSQGTKSSETETAGATVQAGTTPTDVTVPVDGEGAQAAATDGKPKAPAKPAIPEHLKKGNRLCAACGKTEASFLEKNPRYSLCQGVDVLCYRKGHRVIYGSNLADVQAKYPDKVGQNDADGKPLIEEVNAIGIKPGILVRGAISYKKVATTTATPAAAAPAATS